jgi:hypothetical protein
MKQNPHIIDGYKGIMPLDLTRVDKKYHNEMISLHLKDIKEYKKEQYLLKPKQRFENSIQRILEQLERDKEIIRLRQFQIEQEKIEYYEKYTAPYLQRRKEEDEKINQSHIH